MAEFPPNLDDGENWLPSDIFTNEAPSRYNPYRLSCMKDLTAHFAALSLLQNHHQCHHSFLTPSRPPPKPPLNSSQLQSVKLAVGDTSVSHLAPWFNGGGGVELGQSLYGYGSGSVLARSDPFYEIQVQPQVDGFWKKRPRLLQRQRNPAQNRVYPFQGCGFGGGGGGGTVVRESSGTGVFHPRIVNPRIGSVPTADVKRKQGVRNRQEYQLTQQGNSLRRVGGVNRQEDCYYHLPPEMGLPQDWTY